MTIARLQRSSTISPLDGAQGGGAPTQLSLREHAGCRPRRTGVERSRLGHCALGVLACGLSLASSAAAGEGAEPTAGTSPAVLEVRLLGGGAALELLHTDQSVYRSVPVVDYGALGGGLGLRLGMDLGSHAQLGWMGSISRYGRTTGFDVHDREAFTDELFQFDDSPDLWTPLGAYLELYPVPELGAFLGVGAGLGFVPPVARPRPGTFDATMYVAGFSLEAGYETSRSERHALGVFLRYAGWSGTESPLFTDFPEGIRIAELSIGIRLALRP